MKDESAVVLDFLSRGKPTMRRPEPLAQVLGDKYFSLLEVIIKPGVALKPGQKLYIGDGKREEVAYIKGRIEITELTNGAKEDLQPFIREIVRSNEQKFVEFFNKADSVTTRLHSLELLPGIGKKHMWDIINARKDKPFDSFKDIQARVPLIPNPEEIVTKRVMMELNNEDRYRVFSPAPVRDPYGAPMGGRRY